MPGPFFRGAPCGASWTPVVQAGRRGRSLTDAATGGKVIKMSTPWNLTRFRSPARFPEIGRIPGTLRSGWLGSVLVGLLLALAGEAFAAEAVGSVARAPVPGDWWAFWPLSQPEVPRVTDPRGRHPIDAFILQTLASKAISPAPQASPRELLRRLHVDLVGLPPTPDEIAAFERDPSPEAWSRRVDALLASPRYGERWGRHWLDVVRFAQSNGYERDAEKLEAWRYRDYVIRAFNEDKPYDRFIREQIAGDEIAAGLVDGDGRSGPAWRDAVVATGFLRLGVHDDEPDDKVLAEYDELDDIVGTTGAAFLGMTVACARCHDHKFDPIPQHDYYALLALFRPLHVGTGGTPGLDSPLFAPLASPSEIDAWKAGRDRERRDLEARREVATDEAARKDLSRRIEALQKAGPPFEWALAARERGGPAPEVRVLSRGNPRSPGAEVKPGFLRAAGGGDASVGAASGTSASGRRRALADWIANPANPLTARVLVNRVWHHHFGRGLVRTTTDFGRVGGLPSHPELLDWLAGEFLRQGWSIKALHRLILTSATWKQSSSIPNPAGTEADPGNDLLWRQNLRRLDAEALRDTLLAISGSLNLEAGGRGFFPALSGEVLAGGSRPGTDWQVSGPSERSRRSVYAYIRRTSMVPMFEAFDYSNATSPLAERPVTTVAPQALMLLNDAFVQEQAAALAQRVRGESVASGGGARSARVASKAPAAPRSSKASPDESLLLRRAWTLATGRSPEARESAAIEEFFGRQVTLWSGLEPRMSFRPDVPDTLSVPYFNALPAERFLVPPGPEWEGHKGLWPREYEGNRALEAGRGPFAFRRGVDLGDGELSVGLVPQVGCSQVGLLLRASVRPGEAAESAVEVVFEPRDGRLSIRRTTPPTATVIASRDGVSLEGGSLRLRIRLDGNRLAVRWGEGSDLILEAVLPPETPATGALGVRAWGSGVGLDRLRWTPAGGPPQDLWPERPRDWARHRALESACLLMLNLNEVAYVD